MCESREWLHRIELVSKILRFPLTFLTYDNEADSGKDGGTSYYEDLKKEVSLQGQVGILLIKSVPSKK